MVAYLFSVAIALCTLCLPAWGAEARQLCTSCHPSHYAEQGGCVGCHRGNPASARMNIAHHRLIAGRFARFTLGETAELTAGRQLLEQYACRRCHISAGKGNRLATPLDTLAEARTPEEIAAAIKSPAQGMPDFRLGERQAVLLVNAILAGARQAQVKDREQPLRVHFGQDQGGKKDVFTSKCGSCHRVLTERQGVVGTGDIGPNLSGLFSPYYPKTFGKGQAWNDERLKRWLVNPRAVRGWARMPPIELSQVEFRELVEMLMVVQGVKK